MLKYHHAAELAIKYSEQIPETPDDTESWKRGTGALTGVGRKAEVYNEISEALT